MRVAQNASNASLSYRFPPGPTGGLNITVRPVGSGEVQWSTRIAWRAEEWHEQTLPLRLAAGDYVVAFDTESTWSNPGREDRDLPPENRSLGFALSSLSLGVA